MRKITIGLRIYLSVTALFIAFAVAFIIFQQQREKEYKVETLNIKLQDYNKKMDEQLQLMGGPSVKNMEQFVNRHDMPYLRVTVVSDKGKVLFDSEDKDYAHMPNHSNRAEIAEALKKGQGADISRVSSTLKRDFFYSATYFPRHSYVIRSALPYNNDLATSLQADQHYIWFALSVMVILTVVLYRFTRRLGDNITKLRTFAEKADKGESLEIEDLVAFPSDELGEIAEKIIKIYKRLQSTRKEQDLLKRQLTQNIAHELKTPVASIQGYLETILNNPQIGEGVKEQFLARCYAQSQRLTSLLQDISTLNRLDDAPEMQSFETVDLSATVNNIIKETALQIEERKMTFDNRMPDDIKVQGNPSLLYSVFRNLTDNAIAYAGEGTTITLSARDEGTQWSFTFEDNGIGVPSEHLARLFERFYRVDKGRSRKMGGTGLGLAIVKNAVLLHGGNISVRNRNTGGLQFTFSLRKEPINHNA